MASERTVKAFIAKLGKFATSKVNNYDDVARYSIVYLVVIVLDGCFSMVFGRTDARDDLRVPCITKHYPIEYLPQAWRIGVDGDFGPTLILFRVFDVLDLSGEVDDELGEPAEQWGWDMAEKKTSCNVYDGFGPPADRELDQEMINTRSRTPEFLGQVRDAWGKNLRNVVVAPFTSGSITGVTVDGDWKQPAMRARIIELQSPKQMIVLKCYIRVETRFSEAVREIRFSQISKEVEAIAKSIKLFK